MDFIRLFKITRHFCKELIISDTDIYGEPKFTFYPVLDLMCCSDQVGINALHTRHIEKALVN